MKRVFITGASSGIGAALAQYYAEQGAVLGLVARWQPVLEQLLAGLPHPERHRLYVLDVNDHAALTAAAEDFIGVGNGVDVVIASAGISQGTLTEHAEDQQVFEQVFATNVLATVSTFTPFIATMKRQAQSSQRDLRLAGVASVAGIRGLPGGGAYNGSKAAVISYCASLPVALRDSGIKVVVTIVPGYIDTPMTQVNHYKMPFLMPVKQFAAKTGAVVARGSSYQVIPWQMGVVAKLLLLLPNRLYDLVFSKAPHKARKSES